MRWAKILPLPATKNSTPRRQCNQVVIINPPQLTIVHRSGTVGCHRHAWTSGSVPPQKIKPTLMQVRQRYWDVIHDTRTKSSKVQGPRSKVQDPRSKIQGARCKVQGARCKVQGCLHSSSPSDKGNTRARVHRTTPSAVHRNSGPKDSTDSQSNPLANRSGISPCSRPRSGQPRTGAARKRRTQAAAAQQ